MEQDGNRSEQHETPWYHTWWWRGLVVVGGIVAVVALWALLRWYIAPQEPPQRKDLVLSWAAIVAGVAGIGTLYLGWRNLRTAQENTERTLRNTREVEEERAREQALQSYLQTIGELLIEGNLRHPQAEEACDEQVTQSRRIVARAQTLAVLQGLDPKRKQILVQFLYEARLISRGCYEL